jgi:hypothetical protein
MFLSIQNKNNNCEYLLIAQPEHGGKTERGNGPEKCAEIQVLQ